MENCQLLEKHLNYKNGQMRQPKERKVGFDCIAQNTPE